MTAKRTSDNDKKRFDNQAENQLKNEAYEQNKASGKHSYSKKADHQ
ncbi:hypothetical protein ACFQPF_08775 [Fictibacillus iocasae]|uniref:DUF3941 domain-containing protein n=1 Tax=Fictibacillus iocasae TaxID=2715437 RepID=A0ABW2NUS5_9BACL